VHLWRSLLILPPERFEHYATLLSIDEQQRAQRFRFARDQQRFTAARGILRMILGRYLNVPPDTLRFTYNSAGKPFLATPYDQNLSFNLSHAGDWVVYAIAHQRLVGIDLEIWRSVAELDGVIQHICTPEEQQVLRALSDEARQVEFLHYWTAKEAYLKAIGVGFQQSPQQVRVHKTVGQLNPISLSVPLQKRGDRWHITACNLETDGLITWVVNGSQAPRPRYWHVAVDEPSPSLDG
jgi:4'-phosphopantetheinyl transferase